MTSFLLSTASGLNIATGTDSPSAFWYIAHLAVLTGLAGYGFHRLMTIILYYKHRKDKPVPKAQFAENQLPIVTVQLPVFNERNVVERLMHSVQNLDYPKEKLQIQLIDDSTDDTKEICKKEVARLVELGFDAEYRHRDNRMGFKAGALEAATVHAKGDFLFILDADFVPEPDVIRQTIHFFTDEKIGLVQTRWGHLNKNQNILTRVQAIFLDGHLQLEQTARNRSGRFFTFNGTAGIWRKQCITEAGGWEHDTLTEDMDLSYRAQLKGWQFIFLNDVVTPAELPADMEGFKSQQHRWTKGSIQVCKKILFDIWKAPVALKIKLEATAHLTANFAYLLLIVLCLLLYPASKAGFGNIYTSFFTNVVLFFFASVCVAIFYVVSQIEVAKKNCWKEILYIPVLLALGVGMGVNNCKAVLEALFNHQTEFVRTPKQGDNEMAESPLPVVKKNGHYKAIKNVLVPVTEFLFGCFFLWIIFEAAKVGLEAARQGEGVARLLSTALFYPFLGFFYTSASSLWKLILSLFPKKNSPIRNS